MRESNNQFAFGCAFLVRSLRMSHFYLLEKRSMMRTNLIGFATFGSGALFWAGLECTWLLGLYGSGGPVRDY